MGCFSLAASTGMKELHTGQSRLNPQPPHPRRQDGSGGGGGSPLTNSRAKRCKKYESQHAESPPPALTSEPKLRPHTGGTHPTPATSPPPSSHRSRPRSSSPRPPSLLPERRLRPRRAEAHVRPQVSPRGLPEWPPWEPGKHWQPSPLLPAPSSRRQRALAAVPEVEPSVPQGRASGLSCPCLWPRCILGGCEAKARGRGPTEADVRVPRAGPPQGGLSSGERQGPASGSAPNLSGGDPEPSLRHSAKCQIWGRWRLSPSEPLRDS